MADQPVFLMADASHFGVVYRINPWMQPDAWQPNAGKAAAVKAWRDLRETLKTVGARVETIEAVPGLPDLVFPANAGVVLDGKVLPARFRHPQRQGEEPVFRAAFEMLRSRGLVEDILELPEGVIQEGAGDCIWDSARGFFWVGHGQRSTVNSVDAIEDAFAQPVVALELISPRFYHLDTCFCPLAGGKVLFYPPAFSSKALAAIHAHVRPEDRIQASDEDAAAFCVNAVNLGREIIMATPPKRLRQELSGLGYRVHAVDLAPFILSGGGAYCMTLRLDRQSRPQSRSDQVQREGAICAAE